MCCSQQIIWKEVYFTCITEERTTHCLVTHRAVTTRTHYHVPTLKPWEERYRQSNESTFEESNHGGSVAIDEKSLPRQLIATFHTSGGGCSLIASTSADSSGSSCTTSCRWSSLCRRISSMISNTCLVGAITGIQYPCCISACRDLLDQKQHPKHAQ